MTPEQCEGKGLIDHRTDVYSLGIVMYELLTGRVPFLGEGYGEILVAHLTKQPEPPSTVNPDVTPQIEAIVMHAIEKDRNRRFQTMDEFAGARSRIRTRTTGLPDGGTVPSASASHSGGTMMLPEGSARLRAPADRRAAPITGQRGPTTQTGPTPTTLSGAASETMNGEVPRKSTAPLFAATRRRGRAIGGVVGVVAMSKKGDSATARRVATAAGGRAEGRVADGHRQQRSARRQGHARRHDRERHDAVGDEGQEGRRDRSTCSSRWTATRRRRARSTTDRSYAVLRAAREGRKRRRCSRRSTRRRRPTRRRRRSVDKPAKDKHHHHSSSGTRRRTRATQARRQGGGRKPARQAGRQGQGRRRRHEAPAAEVLAARSPQPSTRRASSAPAPARRTNTSTAAGARCCRRCARAPTRP